MSNEEEYRYFGIYYQVVGAAINGCTAHIEYGRMFTINLMATSISYKLKVPKNLVQIIGFQEFESKDDFIDFFDATPKIIEQMELHAMERATVKDLSPTRNITQVLLSDHETVYWQKVQVKKLGRLIRETRDAPVWNWVIVQEFLEGTGFSGRASAIQHCKFLGYDPESYNFSDPQDN
jgi:hypothetical protein